MKLEPMKDDDEITTIRVTRLIRRKLGELVNHNETLDQGLERILDEELKQI